MIAREDIIADMHTHTIASLHAYSTVDEIINYAGKAGMKYVAITDHYFCQEDDFTKSQMKPRIKFMEDNVNPHSDVKVIGSMEFNILQDKEYRKTFKFLKWKPIGLHQSLVQGVHEMTYDDLYEGFVQAAEWNTAFNHIERELDKLCYGKFTDGLTREAKDFLERVVLLAGEKNIFLEINENSLESSRNYIPTINYWMDIASQNGNRFCLGTDAHFCREAGDFERCIKLLNEYGIDKSRVLNCNEDEVASFLR